ncbi:MAG: hypothetical protein ABIJ96_18135 [Elusimicrobiota bacterium]
MKNSDPLRPAPLICLLIAMGAYGCVAVPLEDGADAVSSGRRYRQVQLLDPGAKDLASLHFHIHAYDFETTRAVSEQCERLYSQIMTDSGLDTFRPQEPYRVVIYGTHEEFLRKTGLPHWSAGAADGTSLYSFAGEHLQWTLPHEVTHLIFAEYMGLYTHTHKWLNEGLAVYEEQQAVPLRASSQRDSAPIAFSAMVTMTPLSEQDRDVNAWYHQVGSVARFMIERSRGPGFHLFLRALRDGKNLDEAISIGYPAQWRSFSDLEQAWRRAH